MKKSIEFMGIATALLLAVAPIAMPTNVSAITDVEGNVIPADGSYTNNSDGTYTLHGTLNGDIWNNGSPTGRALKVSIEGIKVNSTGEVTLDAPAFDGYRSTLPDNKYKLMLDGGDVYLWTLLTYEPIDGTTIDSNATPGVEYSTTVVLTKDAYTCQYNGVPITAPGTDDFVKLPAGSSWKVDREMYNDGTYYRVGNNIWINKHDTKQANPNIITTRNTALLYKKDGTKITNRALAANTPWYTDRSETINGQKMYRVATDEWVAANDVQ